MFDKLKFNNLVITNKNLIRQARVQTIAKFVQKLRKIKYVLDKQPENDKFKDRKRKNEECLSQLKSLKCADIMRQTLLQHGTTKAVLSNGRSTPEEIAIAMLSVNKIMQKILTEFQQALELENDTTASWRSEIIELSKRRAKLERVEEKRSRRKEQKEQKAQARKRLEWLEQHQVKKEESDTETLEQYETNQVDAQVPVAKQPKINLETSRSTQLPKVRKEKGNLIKSGKERPSGQKLNCENEDIAIQSKEPKGIKRENGLVRHAIDKPLADEPTISNKRKINKIERPTHVIDPFFITENGQPYLSTAVDVSGSDSNSENDEEDRTTHYRTGILRRNESRQNLNKNRGQRKAPNAAVSLVKQTNNPIIADKSKTTAESSGCMHPSWIAKQKLKPKIATYTGSKIKFDDD